MFPASLYVTTSYLGLFSRTAVRNGYERKENTKHCICFVFMLEILSNVCSRIDTAVIKLVLKFRVVHCREITAKTL